MPDETQVTDEDDIICFATPSDFDLEKICNADDGANLAVFATVDKYKNYLIVVWGDGAVSKMKLDAFVTSGDGTKPDFGQLMIIDCGNTIIFGSYEVASDFIVENADEWLTVGEPRNRVKPTVLTEEERQILLKEDEDEV